MGSYLGIQKNDSVLSDGLGESTTKKRLKRDHYLNLLYNMGMDRDIYLNHSDHWDVVRRLADLAKEYGQVGIDAINQNIDRTTDNNNRTNRWIYSAKAMQVEKIAETAQEIIRKKKEEERKAREKEEQERLEQERKAREAQSSAQPPASQPAIPGTEGIMSNPYVLGGSILGAGTLLLLLLRG